MARTAVGLDKDGVAPGSERTPGATPTLAQPATLPVVDVGFKAARLGVALSAGLPVLPGWVVPISESRGAVGAGRDAVRAHGVPAGRVAVLGQALDPALEAELRGVVVELGGRVIVRSSSPLERDAVWAGAFSSVTGVGPDDVARAVRSGWASAFAVDPLRRLEACGLGLEALQLAVLVQPEITPEAGGVARTEPRSGAGPEVAIEGVRGHPGALLSGWAEGAAALVGGAGASPTEDGGLARLIGPETVADVADLARRVHAELGDDVIEWAACDGTVWLLQSQRSTPRSDLVAPACVPAAGPPHTASATGPSTASAAPSPITSAPLETLVTADLLAAPAVANAKGTPALAALIQGRGTPVPARAAAPGTAAGPLLVCRPHETVARDCLGAILLVDRPVPALAPLLFGARGVIARSGAAGSHLAEVARSLGVPMVTGCRTETVTGPDPAAGAWTAAVNGTTGEVTLLFTPSTGWGPPRRGAPGGGPPARR